MDDFKDERILNLEARSDYGERFLLFALKKFANVGADEYLQALPKGKLKASHRIVELFIHLQEKFHNHHGLALDLLRMFADPLSNDFTPKMVYNYFQSYTNKFKYTYDSFGDFLEESGLYSFYMGRSVLHTIICHCEG